MHLDLMRRKEKQFPSIPERETMSGLRVWHCKYTTLSGIAEFTHLEELVIAGFPDKSFGMLAPLGKLRYLKVVDMPSVAGLGDLGDMASLEAVSLATSPSWDASGKVLTIASLKPLAKLPRLRHLELFGVVPQDKSLAPLKDCKSLESLRVSKYPASEVEEFYASTGVVNRFNPPASFE